jgi:hypothetical protein
MSFIGSNGMSVNMKHSLYLFWALLSSLHNAHRRMWPQWRSHYDIILPLAVTLAVAEPLASRMKYSETSSGQADAGNCMPGPVKESLVSPLYVRLFLSASNKPFLQCPVAPCATLFNIKILCYFWTEFLFLYDVIGSIVFWFKLLSICPFVFAYKRALLKWGLTIDKHVLTTLG